MNNHILVFMWVSIFGFILYQRYASNTVLILCGCVMSMYFYYDYKASVQPAVEQEDNENMLEWLDTLTSTTEQGEIDRCFNEIKNMLYSDNIKEHKYNHEFINTLIDKHKPKIPLASNIDPADQYSVAVGFTKCQ